MSIVSSTSRALYVDAIRDMRKDVFHDRNPLFRGCLVDDERRVDPDVRVVPHGDQAALEALLEDQPAGLLVELLLRGPVLHKLDADEKSPAAHLADERELLLQP